MLRPFFTYYGGKWRVAKSYPAPLFDCVVEPFAGAAGYSLRHPHKQVLLVDRDETIAALWSYLIRVSAEEIRALPLWSPDWESVDDAPVIPEARNLIGFWLNKGTAAPCKRPSAWMRAGTHNTSFWGEAIRERIARQVDTIRHWRVLCADYTQIPDVRATWFVDPPYQTQGRHYRVGKVNYPALAAWCQSRSGQIIVCEAQGADWLPFQPHRSIKANESRTGGKVSNEVVWVHTNHRRHCSCR